MFRLILSAGARSSIDNLRCKRFVHPYGILNSKTGDAPMALIQAGFYSPVLNKQVAMNVIVKGFV